NIVGTLLMMILEKTREIGILESMGASRQSLRKLFLWIGLLIGVAGTVIGEGLALGFGMLQAKYGIIPLPEEAYYMNTAPIELHPLDFVIVAAATMLLCMLAAYVPARVAARIEPIRAIHFR
ncbi:MAG: FtsX-like permease family protein, partial [Rhodothermales bacterium]